MRKSDAITKKEKVQKDIESFSELNEYNHERNEVASAQKQMASQETTGVFDDQE